MTGRRTLLILCALVVSSCKHAQPMAKPKAAPVDRKVIGIGHPYRGLENLDLQKLQASMAYRRQKAWEVVEKVIREVPVPNSPDLGSFNPQSPPSMPLWQTWYEQDELREMFSAMYENAGADFRRARRDFCPTELSQALQKHAAKMLHYRWRGDRFENRLKQFQNLEQVRGISGRGVTLYSPAVILHYLMNYQKAMQCEQIKDTLTRASMPVDPLNFAACLKAEFPDGKGLNRQFALQDFSHCPEPAAQRLALQKQLEGEIGVAAAVKTAWHKVEGGNDLAVFKLDASHLDKAFTTGEWQPDYLMDPESLAADKIYTIEVIPQNTEIANARYLLTALHIVTKDVRDWMWISLIWSPDANQDLGSDRPASLNAEIPWNNYKLCVVTGYEEGSADPSAEFPEHLTLQDSVRAGVRWATPHTSCSNPYIERGVGNARTNCIGCHQHARTGVGQDKIFKDDLADPQNAANRALYPHSARSKVRTTFPSDYFWSFFDHDIRVVVENKASLDGG